MWSSRSPSRGLSWIRNFGCVTSPQMPALRHAGSRLGTYSAVASLRVVGLGGRPSGGECLSCPKSSDSCVLSPTTAARTRLKWAFSFLRLLATRPRATSCDSRACSIFVARPFTFFCFLRTSVRLSTCASASSNGRSVYASVLVASPILTPRARCQTTVDAQKIIKIFLVRDQTCHSSRTNFYRCRPPKAPRVTANGSCLSLQQPPHTHKIE